MLCPAVHTGQDQAELGHLVSIGALDAAIDDLPAMQYVASTAPDCDLRVGQYGAGLLALGTSAHVGASCWHHGCPSHINVCLLRCALRQPGLAAVCRVHGLVPCRSVRPQRTFLLTWWACWLNVVARSVCPP